MKKLDFTMLLSIMLCFSLMAGCSQTAVEETEITVTSTGTAAASTAVSDEDISHSNAAP